jgi:hypothetical protein
MVFTEVGKTTLIFDKELLLSKTREALLMVMPESDTSSHMLAFTYELRTGEIHRHNMVMYDYVSRLMFEKIRNSDSTLNATTKYSYDGIKDVNNVLEDFLTAVSSSSDCLWITGKPIMNDDSNLAVTIQQIRPMSWLKRKLGSQPKIVRETTFESGKATRVTGSCRKLAITVLGRNLKVSTQGFDWLN